MTKPIFLSPHLDDVILSCGGLLYETLAQGQQAMVINIFAGLPPSDMVFSDFANYQHQMWGQPQQAYQLRHQEDRAALAHFNLQPCSLDLLDCIYRGEPEKDMWYYTSDEDIFGPIHQSERSNVGTLQQTIAQTLGAHKVTPPWTFYSPLGLGNHVDHQLTFLATRIWQAEGHRVYFYEDYPYVQRDAKALAQTLSNFKVKNQVIPLSPTAFNTKIRAIGEYNSQLNTLFGGINAMPKMVQAYADSVGSAGQPAERIWELAL